MQGQAELGEPLRQNLQHLFRILPVLKTQYGVVGISDLVRFPFQPGLHRFPEPFVQDLVQVNISQKRTDWLALAGSYFAHDQFAVVDGSYADPLADQPEHATVRHTSTHHPYKIFPNHRVEAGLDVQFQNPARGAGADRPSHFIQRLMLTAPGPKPVGAIEEIHLVDGI